MCICKPVYQTDEDSTGDFQNDLPPKVEIRHCLQHRIGIGRVELFVGNMLLCGCIVGIDAGDHFLGCAYICDVSVKAPDQLRCA